MGCSVQCRFSCTVFSCSNVAVGFFKVFTNGFQALISYGTVIFRWLQILSPCGRLMDICSGFDVLRVFALLSHDRGRNATSGLLFLLLLMIWTAQAVSFVQVKLHIFAHCCSSQYTSVEVNVTLVKDPVLGNVCADSSTAPSNVGWP